jgi:hypothetical protein
MVVKRKEDLHTWNRLGELMQKYECPVGEPTDEEWEILGYQICINLSKLAEWYTIEEIYEAVNMEGK